MELVDYWHTIRRRWRVVLGVFVLVVAAAALLTSQMTPQYQSTTRLFVSTSESDTSAAYQGNLFATQRVTSYADLVSSRQLADRVADQVGGDPQDLQDQVEATVVPETVILEISATDPDPARARTVAEAYGVELSTLVDDLETPSGKSNALIKATIVDDAQEGEAPVSPQVPRNLGLAAVLGLLLGVGLAVVRELLDTSITSAEDVAAVTAAPVLGNIFVDQAANLPPGEGLARAGGWSEAFRVLRTNMQYVDVDSDQKVVVISSSLPEEGKTTTAINLALTMAMADQRVALVECDLRRPLVASRLGLDSAVGTTSVLIGKVGVGEAMQRYAETSLDVLACGPVPPNPSELLQSHAMEKMLVDLRGSYDVVILDAPPLLPVTDAALLAVRADGAVVVVRHGRSTHDQLAHALDRLDAVDARTLGVVVNMSPAKKAGSAYGYGYGYGDDGKADLRRSRRETREAAKAAKAAKALDRR